MGFIEVPPAVDFPVCCFLSSNGQLVVLAGCSGGTILMWRKGEKACVHPASPLPPKKEKKTEHRKCLFLQSHIYKFHLLPEARSHNADRTGSFLKWIVVVGIKLRFFAAIRLTDGPASEEEFSSFVPFSSPALFVRRAACDGALSLSFFTGSDDKDTRKNK